jgi:hypothetical protein
MVKVVEEQFGSRNGELPQDLDGLAREGARRMLAVALGLEVEAYLARHAQARTSGATPWWSGTGKPGCGRCRWARARWRSRRRGFTIGGRGRGSRAGSCRPGCGGARR